MSAPYGYYDPSAPPPQPGHPAPQYPPPPGAPQGQPPVQGYGPWGTIGQPSHPPNTSYGPPPPGYPVQAPPPQQGFAPPHQAPPPQQGFAPAHLPPGWTPFPTAPGVHPGVAPEGYKMKPEWDEKREKKVRKQFDEYMQDGRLDVHEVQKCMSKLGYDMTPEQATWFVNNVDKDRSGSISWEEYKAGVIEYVKLAPKTGKSKDKKEKKDKKDKKEDKPDKKEKKDKKH